MPSPYPAPDSEPFGADRDDTASSFDDADLDGFDEEELDAASDDEINRFIQLAAPSGGRANQSALSALTNQLSNFPPLSPEDQEDRFAVYRAGQRAQTDSAGKKPTSRQASAIRAGEYAHTELIGSMYRLVLIIARDLAGRRFGREHALEMLPDLVGDANLALVEAVQNYDSGRGPTFNVYAAKVIRERIRMRLSKTGPVDGLPASWVRVKRLAVPLIPELEVALGRHPTIEEIKEALRERCLDWADKKLSPAQRNLPLAQRREAMHAKLVKQGMWGAVDRLDEVLRASQHLTSLDAPVGDENGSSYGEFLTTPGDGSTFDRVELAHLRDDLLAALATLPERDREIVFYRFGFVDGTVWTYAALAPHYGISPERIRQIERNVMSKLRAPAFGQLATYLPSHADDEPPAQEPPDEDPNRRRRPQ